MIISNKTVCKTVCLFLPADFLVPPALQCGGIQDNLHRPGLYFSDGGDRTLLHRNDVDYISCLLDGHQELVLYDKVKDYLGLVARNPVFGVFDKASFEPVS